jgi:hypothetical protein
MEFKEKMVFSDLAEYIGVDKAIISRAVQTGRITPDCLTTGICSDGKTRRMLLTDKAIKALDSNRRTRKKQPAQKLPTTLIEYQTEKCKWEAVLKKLEAQKTLGQLVDREKWEKAFFQIFEGIRDNFASGVEYLSKTILNVSDEDEIKKALYSEYKRIFGGIETYRSKIKKELGLIK